MGTTGSQASRGKDGSRTGAGSSLVLQPATEFSPASFPSPAACLEAEVPQLIPESLVVHGSVVLGLTKVRMLWEELLVAAFEDVHLGVVQAGVVVSCTVPFPDEAAHSWSTLRREFTVENEDDSLVQVTRHDGTLQQKGLGIPFQGQVHSILSEDLGVRP